jgi:hypothetical protein
MESESTVARATHEMSSEQLDALVRHHEAITAQYRVALQARKVVPEATQKGQSTDIEGNVPSVGILIPDLTGSKFKPKTVSTVAPKSYRATVEEVDDEDDLIILSSTTTASPVAGPSRSKGKGPDAGNWGDVSGLQNFFEADIRAQRELLANYEGINRVIKQEEHSMPTDFLVDFSPVRTSSPKMKVPRKRSKGSKARKAKTQKEAAQPATKVDELARLSCPRNQLRRLSF